MRLRIGLLGLLPLAACTQNMPEPESAPPPQDCPVLDSRNWHAWIDAMPGPDPERTLNISGEVDLPAAGYEASLKAGPSDRAMPPGQRFELELTPPEGMAAQVVTPTPVKYRAKASYPAYRVITITCAGQEIATMPDVMVAE